MLGASYAALARAGGGCQPSRQHRAASEAELLAQALPRVDALIAEGVSMIEIKSGYGLQCAAELKMLRVARRLAQMRPVRIKTSFLGAHVVPPNLGVTLTAILIRCAFQRFGRPMRRG